MSRSKAPTAVDTTAATRAHAEERRAAEARMLAAVARISGAGVLAFATNAAVRAEFAALVADKARA